MINKNMHLSPEPLKKGKISSKKQLSAFCSRHIEDLTIRKTSPSNFSTFTTHKKKESSSLLINPISIFGQELKQTPQLRNHLSLKISVQSTYTEKLLQIEKIIADCKELSIKFGFFYLTKAMIQFQPQGNCISCWIHPNRNIKKPLHPIIKRNAYDAQREFYFQLKSFLKELYPTIPQPFGNSYQELKQHIKALQNSVGKKILRKKSFTKLEETTKALARVKSQQQLLWEKEKQLSELLNIHSPKFEKTIQPLNLESQSLQISQKEDSVFEKNMLSPLYYSTGQKGCIEYQKNTMSTLLDSVNSNGSLAKRLIQEKKKCFQREYQGKKSVIIENKEDSQKEEESSRGLESDFDQLFSNNSADLEKELELQKVAKQFEDLLFD